MSEREPSGCFSAALVLWLLIIGWALLLQGIKDHFEIRDLQRRVGELEQKR